MWYVEAEAPQNALASVPAKRTEENSIASLLQILAISYRFLSLQPVVHSKSDTEWSVLGKIDTCRSTFRYIQYAFQLIQPELLLLDILTHQNH